MFLFKTHLAYRAFITEFKQKGKTIGFVPTLGALHQGHMSLIDIAKKKSDFVVCSIFLNPTQFNNAEDLVKYPVTISSDLQKLFAHGCDAVFLPSQTEVYPDGTQMVNKLDLEGLDKLLEGAFRPGHFDGVVQVVRRLLEMIEPDILVMGKKDYQQLTIIKKMLEKLQWKHIELIGAEILREPNGLAMSSRNERLSPKTRQKAAKIYEVLKKTKLDYGRKTIDELKQEALQALSFDEFNPEYFEIIDRKTLKSIESKADSDQVLACVAVWAGDVRLIDNIEL